MVTIKQRTAAKVVVSGGLPTEGMRVAKYAKSVIRKPKVLTDSKGYKEALKDLGLNEELVVGALVEDIKAKPQNRVPELRLGTEILKMTEGDKTLFQLNGVIIKIQK